MEVVNNGDRCISFYLKEYDTISKTESFFNQHGEKLFNIDYDVDGYPAIITIKYHDEYETDFLECLCIEEFEDRDSQLTPYLVYFIQDANLIGCEKISVSNDRNVLICIEENFVKGVIIYNTDIYDANFLVDCSYKKLKRA